MVFGITKGTKASDGGKPILLYRGEHGKQIDGEFGLQTRLGSFSFSTFEVASTYALKPNERNAIAHEPRVYPVYLRIKKPFCNINHCFLDFDSARKAVGMDIAKEYFIKYSGVLENTNNWEEINENEEYSGVEEFINKEPERCDELYADMYYFLDDKEFVKILKDKVLMELFTTEMEKVSTLKNTEYSTSPRSCMRYQMKSI